MYTLTGHHCHDSRRSAGVRPFPFNYTIAYPDKACHLMWVMATFGLAIMTSCGLRDEGSYDYTSAPLQHEATRWYAATFDAAATPSVSLSYWDL